MLLVLLVIHEHLPHDAWLERRQYPNDLGNAAIVDGKFQRSASDSTPWRAALCGDGIRAGRRSDHLSTASLAQRLLIPPVFVWLCWTTSVSGPGWLGSVLARSRIVRTVAALHRQFPPFRLLHRHCFAIRPTTNDALHPW